ncbi:uracil-DNA glycosylase [Spiroplasma helicoides]|uniref:Uracil-DNA glycosylase n=1 Tax=Spiroplasma helicoides TaxID=216938 RepID=A0A1B3SJ73_9MOLU|nr:uracil-DNA glycosylase [Spiroplasma helicoides]AOG59983.1 uracil-DNA glycosylase [Spiroplasma helicoides]
MITNYMCSIKENWKKIFTSVDIFNKLTEILGEIEKLDKVCPKKEEIFKVFELLDFDKVKVVIIGQDPYHTPNVANGIAFSSNNNSKTPASLRNIFKELKSDLNIDHFNKNDLSGWVEQGVLLLNTSLSVKENEPASHKNLGWEKIILELLKKLYESNRNIIFCLWGNFSKTLYNKLNIKKGYVIESAHPSPFSYKKGFENSKPFSKINGMLKKIDGSSIDWSL